jgi:hypothetical protein
MGVTADHRAGQTDPSHLTVIYTTNPDGWITAQIAEFPAAISQGRSEHEAWVNVLEALHDLTHEPTLAERIAFTAQARIVEPVSELIDLIGPLNERLDRLVASARDRHRARV